MKWLTLFAVLGALATLSYGNTISLSAANLGGNMVAIGYNGSTAPVAFGLNITTTSGAKITSIVSSSSYFPIHPGTITIDWSANITDYGTLVSPSVLPGAAGSGLGTSKIVLEMAVQGNGGGPNSTADFNYDGLVNNQDLAVYASNWLISGMSHVTGDINADNKVNFADYAAFLNAQSYILPPISVSQLLVLQIDLNGAANTTITVTPESAYRGGIIGYDAASLTASPASIIIPEPATIALFAFGGLLLRKSKT